MKSRGTGPISRSKEINKIARSRYKRNLQIISFVSLLLQASQDNFPQSSITSFGQIFVHSLMSTSLTAVLHMIVNWLPSSITTCSSKPLRHGQFLLYLRPIARIVPIIPPSHVEIRFERAYVHSVSFSLWTQEVMRPGQKQSYHYDNNTNQ